MRHKIIFRADGNKDIGLGHIVRTLALANMLKNDFNCVWVIQQPSAYLSSLIKENGYSIIPIELATTEDEYNAEASQLASNYLIGDEIIVIDGYHFRTAYQKQIKSKGSKLVAIDDLHAWHSYADVIINHAEEVSPNDYKTESYTKLCLGLKYALLRSPFLTRKNIYIPKQKKIFVSMGGADVFNVSEKVIHSIVAIKEITAITLLIGDVNPHSDKIKKLIQNDPGYHKVKIQSNLDAAELYNEIRSSTIAICPASSIAIESCATGVGLISGYTADNQLAILKGLKQHRCLIDLGDLTKVSSMVLSSTVCDLLANPLQINEMINNQCEMIDGNSPERISEVFKLL